MIVTSLLPPTGISLPFVSWGGNSLLVFMGSMGVMLNISDIPSDNGEIDMKVIMTGGGTGGHIYPAIAVAEEIRRRNPEAEILFVGTDHGMEKDIIPKYGYELKFITVSGLNRNTAVEKHKNCPRSEKRHG